MSAATATVRGRAAAAALMTDACTISAPDADGVLNESTGQYTPAAGAARYTGACRIKLDNAQDRIVEAGERPVSLRTFVVSVPMSMDTARIDDVVRVTASVLDSGLVGIRLRVVDVPKGTYLTARRLVAEEQS